MEYENELTDGARSQSYPCVFQAPSLTLSSGKLHLYVHASGGWYNSLDAPQCWWRKKLFPYEWLWLHSTDLCTWKIGILDEVYVCVSACVRARARVCVHVCLFMHVYKSRMSQHSNLSPPCLNREIRFTCKVNDKGNRCYWQSLVLWTIRDIMELVLHCMDQTLLCMCIDSTQAL